jgi:hypothetical protein
VNCPVGHGLHSIPEDPGGFGHRLLGGMVRRGDEVISQFVLLENALGLLYRAQLLGMGLFT